VVVALIVAWVVTLPAALARADPPPEQLVFFGRGPLRQDGSREHLGSSTDPWGGAVYLATIEDDRATVERISPPSHNAVGLSVAPCGRIVWVTDGCRPRSVLTTVSYPGLRARKHPDAVPPRRSGWVLLSPDGLTLAYPVHPDDRHTQVQCEDLETGRARVLPGRWLGLRQPAWSPDAKRIAFYAVEDADPVSDWGLCLHVVDVTTGKARELARPSKSISVRGRELRWPPVWSSTGDAVYFQARYAGDGDWGLVYRAPLEGDSGPTPVAPGRFIGTSSDAQTLYVSNGDEVRAIQLGSKQPGTVLLTESEHWCMYPKVSPSGGMLAYHDGQSSVIVRPLRHPAKRITVTNDIGTNSMFYWITTPPRVPGASPSGREASDR